MIRAHLTAYPWDLIDEREEAVLDRLRGEIGVTGLSLWVASPPVRQLRVRDVEPRIFSTRGGLFFRPSDEPYTGTRCKPLASGWHKGSDPLARIADACADRSLDLRAVVSATATGRVAQRHPEMACKNVFGAVSDTGLCLANPDVQSYLCGLVTDLSGRYQLTGVSIADFALAWPEAWNQDLRCGVPLDDMARSLLGICFCESCHQGDSRSET